MKILDWLQGKKTYLGSTVLAIIAILADAGVIGWSDTWVKIAVPIVALFTGAALRAAVAKVTK